MPEKPTGPPPTINTSKALFTVVVKKNLKIEFYKIENYRTLLSLICKERFFVRLKLDLFTFTW